MATKAKKPRPEPSADSLKAAVVCGICMLPYTNPVALKACGHSFCRSCIKETRFYFECPICGTSNETNFFNHKKETTFQNIPLKRAVDYAEKLNQADQICGTFTEYEDTCPHQHLVGSLTICQQHCDAKFCDACFFHHLERVRLEIAWRGCKLEDRWNDAVENLAGHAVSTCDAIDACVRASEEEVNKLCDSLLEDFYQVIVNNEKIPTEDVFDVTNVFEKVEEFKKERKGMSEVAVELTNTTMLHLNQKRLFEVYKQSAGQDSCLHDAELFTSYPLTWGLKISNYATVAKVSKQLRKSSSSFYWCYGDEKSPERHQADTVLRQLHDSVKNGDLPAVKKVLEALSSGCRIYAVERRIDQEGNTLLLQAIDHGQLEVAKYLLELGANIRATKKNDTGTLAIHVAISKGNNGLVKLLADFDPEILDVEDDETFPSPCCNAVLSGNLELIRFLVEELKLNVNCRGSSDSSPMLLACELGNLDLVKYFIEHGAKTSARTRVRRSTALQLAINSGNFELVRYLYEINPGMVYLVNADLDTALHFAVDRCNFDIAKWLASEIKVNVFKENKWKENVVHVAIFRIAEGILAFLANDYSDLVEETITKLYYSIGKIKKDAEWLAEQRLLKRKEQERLWPRKRVADISYAGFE